MVVDISEGGWFIKQRGRDNIIMAASGGVTVALDYDFGRRQGRLSRDIGFGLVYRLDGRKCIYGKERRPRATWYFGS